MTSQCKRFCSIKLLLLLGLICFFSLAWFTTWVNTQMMYGPFISITFQTEWELTLTISSLVKLHWLTTHLHAYGNEKVNAHSTKPCKPCWLTTHLLRKMVMRGLILIVPSLVSCIAHWLTAYYSSTFLRMCIKGNLLPVLHLQWLVIWPYRL